MTTVDRSFTCPRCGAVSHNPHDVAEGYCGRCHDWTGVARHFVDDRHTLYCGWVLALALQNGLPAEPVLDEKGNYTDRIALHVLGSYLRRDPRVTITLVVPYPPEDWNIADGEAES